MSRARFAAHVALAAAALSLMMLAVAVGVGQGQSGSLAEPGQATTAPSQLTQEYPLGEKKLARGSVAKPPAAASNENGPSEGGSLLWLLLLAPVAVLVLLVWLVAYARSGPPTAYGYALGNEERRRRQVPGWVIKLLTPLFAYNHHRDAYILRGIGNRRGPVLKLRTVATEPGPVGAAVAPAPAPLGVRGETMPPRFVRNGTAPAPKAAAPKAKAKPAKSKTSKNGKGTRTAPKAPKPKAKPARDSSPSLTDAMAGEGKSGSARAKRRADYRARKAGDAEPTGRFKRDENGARREDRPAPKTRK